MKRLLSHGIGTDIESTARFEKLDRKRHATFLERVYTPQEMDYCYSYAYPAAHLAVRFCAKEAVAKALHTMGEHGYWYRDIEIVLNEDNVPEVNLKPVQIHKLPDFNITLSLSHCDDKAIAFAMVEMKS